MADHHILIVEDEPNTAEMLTTYFESHGYKVTAVGWGKQALVFVRDTLPDLIVLDIRLPDIDGYEVCRQLRSHRRTAHVPIIFLTERRERIDRLAGLELGAVDYITKPFDIQELRLRVRNVLQRASKEAVTHPVTGLPYASLFEQQLTEMLQRPRWAVVAVSIEELRAFGEAYGFVARDDLLRAVALMVEHIAEEDAGKEPLVGQIDDGLFCIITTPEHAGRVRERLTARLQETMGFFYPRTDWKNAQRQASSDSPRLLVRMGILTSPGNYQNPSELQAAIRKSLSPAS